MQLTLTAPILLLALVLVIVWKTEAVAILVRTIAALRAARLRRAMEREIGGVVVPVVGQMLHDMPDRVLADYARVRGQKRPMYVLIDSPGGICHVGMRIVRALSSHVGTVIAVVPRRAWSNGAMVALGADIIAFGPDANLGPCCPIGHVDDTDLNTAAVVRAAEDKIPEGLVRARWMIDEQARAITQAQVRRGASRDAAERLAWQLTSGHLGTHWIPLFAEDCRSLGIGVAPDHADPRWEKLARLYLAALEPHLR